MRGAPVFAVAAPIVGGLIIIGADGRSIFVSPELEVRVAPVAETENGPIARLAGTCIDSTEVQFSCWEVDAGLLRADDNDIVTEVLHTHLLKSCCGRGWRTGNSQ